MTQFAFVHSYRGGSGKSTVAANVAALLAAEGRRVGLVDSNFQAPGLHHFFDIANPLPTLNDYLQGRYAIQEVAHEVDKKTVGGRRGTRSAAKESGALYLVPASDHVNRMAYIWARGFDMDLLTKGYVQLAKALSLDLLIVDTDPGLDRQTYFALELADSFVMVMTPDQHDYRGAAATVQIAHLLEIPNIVTILNKVPEGMDSAALKETVEQLCDWPLSAQLPYASEMLQLAGSGLFVRKHPKHALTTQLQQIGAQLMVETQRTFQDSSVLLASLLSKQG
jgi:MinD-like ATPase involved in chromosome partitioning or flagellar assembly